MNYNRRQGWIGSRYELEYFKYGSYALLIEWPRSRNRDTLDKILHFQNQLKYSGIEGMINQVPGYHSLTIFFDPKQTNHHALISAIEDLDLSSDVLESKYEITEISVDYSPSCAPDLPFVAESLGLKIEEVIRIHAEPTYDVHFIGFLPGFLYLGGLSEQLSLKRRDNPRLRVPAGSVALAGGQTGIYPIESPGGWHIIGRTEFKLFDPYNKPPCPIGPGMKIKFKPVSHA